MKKKSRLTLSFLAACLGLALLSGCSQQPASGGQSTQSAPDQSAQVRKIKYAFTNTLKPVSYIDENGNPAGYDVEVIKKIDELLPQYEIELIGTSSEDAWLGVETGKYQLCTTNSYRTAAREEKYLFATQNQGGNLQGLVVRKEHADVKTLPDVHDKGLRLTPLRPADAIYAVIDTYNKENPDKAVTLQSIDQFENADAVKWVAEGRYDVFPMASTIYDSMVTAPDGQLHDLSDKLSYSTYDAIATWALINKDETEFRGAYQEALIGLKNDGTLSELSQEYMGTDIFQYFK